MVLVDSLFPHGHARDSRSGVPSPTHFVRHAKTAAATSAAMTHSASRQHGPNRGGTEAAPGPC